MNRFLAFLLITSPFAAVSESVRDATELREKVIAAERAVEEAAKDADKEFDTWADKLPEGPPELQPGGAIGVFDFDSVTDGAPHNDVYGGKPARLNGSPSALKGRKGGAVVFDGRNGVVFPGLGRFARSDAFTFSLWLKAPPRTAKAVILHRNSVARDAGSLGYTLAMEDGFVAFEIRPARAMGLIKVRTKVPIVSGEWTHLAVAYDGSSRATGMQIFVNGDAAGAEVFEGGQPENPDPAEEDLALASHPREAGLKGGAVDEFRIFGRQLAPIEIAALAGRNDFTAAVQSILQLTPAQRSSLLAYYIATAHHGSIEARAALKAARDAEDKRPNPASK